MIPDGFRSSREDVNINREGADVLKQLYIINISDIFVALKIYLKCICLEKINIDRKEASTYIRCNCMRSAKFKCVESFSTGIDIALKY